MIRINLLPLKEAQRAIGRRRRMSLALLSVAVAVLVMLVPYLMQGRTLDALDREVSQLNSDIAKLNTQAVEVRDLEKKAAALQAKLKVIDDLKQKRVGPVHILDDLGGATPEKLWLVDASEVGGQATITGMALDNQTIAEFMRRLQSSKYFYEVDLVETSQSDPAGSSANSANANSAKGFKKFIVRARVDYLGTGGKAEVAAGGEPPARPKTGA
jgi:type IV pilus assembly protein PilN